ncbi:MAG: GntR family transcriptional regulator [Desulfarculaceae bacterium]|jgi:DNA-binding transcriptional MocR family regulator
MRKTRKGAKLNETPVPRYFQLQMDLLRGIEGGKWAPGEAIPPERKIAEQFGVSLGTVNRAIMNLVSEGYLYRLQGKGTFVSGTDIPLSSVRYKGWFSVFWVSAFDFGHRGPSGPATDRWAVGYAPATLSSGGQPPGGKEAGKGKSLPASALPGGSS